MGWQWGNWDTWHSRGSESGTVVLVLRSEGYMGISDGYHQLSIWRVRRTRPSSDFLFQRTRTRWSSHKGDFSFSHKEKSFVLFCFCFLPDANKCSTFASLKSYVTKCQLQSWFCQCSALLNLRLKAGVKCFYLSPLKLWGVKCNSCFSLARMKGLVCFTWTATEPSSKQGSAVYQHDRGIFSLFWSFWSSGSTWGTQERQETWRSHAMKSIASYLVPIQIHVAVPFNKGSTGRKFSLFWLLPVLSL